ncbi:FAD-dependent monooxygenase [Streptosporangium sp. NPDC005286]|uniref:FAD-dependent oxidoreductase n=1 Tax=Streptosporangium sp. NPDC005286 TaxID=3154463 RepID=UPI0033B75D87
MARTFRAGRVLLAADAAHVHSPAGGQGMNIGVPGAIALIEALTVALSGEQADPDRYTADRRPPGRHLRRSAPRAGQCEQEPAAVQEPGPAGLGDQPGLPPGSHLAALGSCPPVRLSPAGRRRGRGRRGGRCSRAEAVGPHRRPNDRPTASWDVPEMRKAGFARSEPRLPVKQVQPRGLCVRRRGPARPAGPSGPG